MKLVVQIPCLNEEQTLPLVLKSIPKKIKGVDSIEVLVIDDGSNDKTVEVAKKHGVKHFVFHPQRRGLARSFHDGLLKALEMGADVIVNTDGDNQYPQERIADLVKPILDGKADMVIADRQVQTIRHFSPIKKLLQRVGTYVLNLAAGTKVPDAPSGFRAYSRDAAFQLNVVTRFSYAMETLIQAGNLNMSIVSVPVITNPKTRESRLFKNSWEHIRKSGITIIRAFIMYKPAVVFVTLGIILGLIGLFPFGRFVYFFIFHHAESRGHVQSLILGSVILAGSFVSFALGVIADLIRINRTLIEDALEQNRRARFDK
ncbi:MAG TPA: glycosyltransferase family 2 protein [Candidatus Saccharimonadales bacterium]